MKRKMTAVFVALLLATACATSGYPAASQQYEADSVLYVAAGNNLQTLRLVGKVTDAQWQTFELYQAATRVADAQVYADLVTWRNSGKEPPDYVAHAAALREAQQNVINLSAGVPR